MDLYYISGHQHPKEVPAHSSKKVLIKRKKQTFFELIFSECIRSWEKKDSERYFCSLRLFIFCEYNVINIGNNVNN